MQGFYRVGLAVALAVALVAGAVSAWNTRASMDKHTSTRMTGKMTPSCVGRFLIDLPEDARVDIGGASVGGFDITAFAESTDDFQARLAQREVEIKSKPDRLGGDKNLEMVKGVKTDSGLVGKIFVHSRTVNEGTAANGLEIERFRYEGIAVEALVHGEGVSIVLGSGFYFPDRIEDLFRLVTQLVPNLHNRVPTEPGFCLDRAYIRDPLEAN